MITLETIGSIPAYILIFLSVVFIILLSFQLIISTRREIKQRKRIEDLESYLEKASERSRQLDKLKTEFVSIASHQLRSPLAAVKGYASMLLEGSFGRLSVGAQEAVGRILTSSTFMARSVDDFLNVSRIELGRMRYDVSEFDLCKVINLVLEEQLPFAKKNNLELSLEKGRSDTLCNITADVGKIKQVLTNLVDNAIKYTLKGSVTVLVKRNDQQKTALIEITDTGMGISKSTLEHLFKKFARANNANEVNVTGTGLGLYVAKNMIDAHGGKIWATSPGEGKGTTFHMELPLDATPYITSKKA